MSMNRRQFVGRAAGLAAGTTWLGFRLARGTQLAGVPGLHVACNSYPWTTFARRDKQDFDALSDEAIAAVAEAKLDGYEPGITRAEQIDQLAPSLRRHGVEMRSIYVNSVLHDRQKSADSIRHIVDIALRAKTSGTRIVVTNPSPIRWGSDEVKSDGQLRDQATALNQLGRALQQHDVTLAYHNHDMELRSAAREFHHMLTGTDPQYVKFCLDAHWIYRGSGNSQVALFDIVKMYGDRIVELHIRQSADHIWTETFGPGDIDYPRLVKMLTELSRPIHLVLEQAIESGSPHKLSAIDAHRQSARAARQVFARLSG